MKKNDTDTFDKIYQSLKKEHSCYNKSYSGYPIGLHEQGLLVVREAELNPCAIHYGLFFQNYKFKDHMDWFWDLEELKKKRLMILDKVKEDEGFIDDVLSVGEENHSRFKRYTEEVQDIDLDIESNESIIETFKKLHNLLLDVSLWSYSVDTFLSDEEDWLEALIKKELGDSATQDVIETLTLPTFSSFVNRAELLFLKITKGIKNGNKESGALLANEYQKKYFWIRTGYKEFTRVSAEQILTESREWLDENQDKDIDELIKLEEGRIAHNIKTKQKLCKNLGISRELQDILRISEVFTYLQDNRKERALRMNTLFYEFVAETQRRFSVPDPLGFYMTEKELFGYYDGEKISISEIQNRYDNGFMDLFFDDSSTIISASKFKKDGVDQNFFKTYVNIKEIIGTTAYRGKIIGNVNVIRSVKEMETFQDGDILVINQTTPEYIPVIKKASAIVTDQGGITCHAAIISRELKKPCIIGTKIATQVLKDGDIVEVDADNGAVRIVK